MVNISLAETPVLDHVVAAYNGGRLVEAEQLCQQIIAAKPDFFDAFYFLAIVQSRLGKNDAALATYNRALKMRPDFAAAHFNLGVLLETLNRRNEALASYDRAIDLRPDFAMAHSNRGNLLETLNRHNEALASYDRAIDLRPDFVVAHYNRGRLLQTLNRHDEALASYDRALALRPDFPEALSNRGNVLLKLNRFVEAVASYDRAIELRPHLAAALSNRGSALQELDRYDEALASYDRAIAVRPDYSGALSNRGIVLHQLQRFEESLASFAGAHAAWPSNAEAHFGEAEVRLLLGDFDRGWKEYEWRSQAEQLRSSKRSFKQPPWLGQSEIADKTVLLYAEQGFGDTIQFCRYAPLLAARGARVILEVQDPLRELMSSLAGTTTQVVSTGSALPDFDVHCPLLSLPLAFGTRLDTIPSAVPYLHASSQGVVDWDTRLGPKRRPWIGLAWSGRPTHKNDHNRSISPSALLSLLDIDAAFVSLQKHVRPDDQSMLNERGDLLHFGDALTDFSATAALIANLDLVISVDTSVAHLAGALAKPVWVLLPFTPDWRWLLDRLDSPWYPTARLFRQDDTRTWDNVIARVHEALRDFIQCRSGS